MAPLGTFAELAGIPGAVFVPGVIGLADSPGGKLLASTLVNPFEFVFLAFVFAVFELVLPPAEPPQPDNVKTDIAAAVIKYFIINLIPSYFKYSYAGSKVASLEVSDGVRTGTGRYQTIFGRFERLS